MKVTVTIDREHLVALINKRIDVPVIPESVEAQAINAIADIVCELLGDIDYSLGPVSLSTECDR